jgi:hypothetical protein
MRSGSGDGYRCFGRCPIVRNMINMMVKEYVGPEMKGFDPAEEPYTKFLCSIGRRKEIGFLVRWF